MTKTETCDAQKRDKSGEKCSLPAGWGTDHVGSGRCKLHGGASSGAPTGRDHGQYDHGGYAEAIEQDLRPAESRAVAEFVGLVASTPYERQAATVAAYGLVRYLRSGDPRHAGVFRRQLDAADVIETDYDPLKLESPTTRP